MYRGVFEIVSLTATGLCCLHFWLACRSLVMVARFFSGAILLGALAEAAAIVVTDSYDYPGFHLYVGPVPLFIAVGWGASFYFTHSVAAALSSPPQSGRLSIWSLGLKSGLVGVLIDLCFDPVAVSLGWWKWEGGSRYFGVPLANFLGWFSFCMAFSVAYAWSEARQGLGVVARTLLFYLLLIVGFAVTALVSFPFL